MNTILESKENGVWILKINRPQSLNALNLEVLAELENHFGNLSRKSHLEVRCVILTGEGEKAFVAGADIKEMSSLNSAEASHFSHKGQKVFTMIEEAHFAVIAAVNGFALGGGLELAMACDFIYASENAKLGLPEVSLGLIPGFGGTVRLQKTVGRAKALEMTMTAEMLSADEALKLGLVNKIFPLAELIAGALKTAQVIAGRAPMAVASAKKCILNSAHLDVYKGQELEAQMFGSLFSSKDTLEGTSAFMEKRKPQFKGE